MSHLLGKPLTITVDTLSDDSKALEAITQDDEIRGAEALYRERLRPQFHFSARRGWNNDPNGLVYHEGTWHLFFQHNPVGWNWGNMHWSHATSPDLVHWREHGIALRPDTMGPMFSGSGVVDWKNTSGLGRDGRPPLCFFYTAAGDPTVQCLASSTDGGRTLEKFSGNPVLKQITSGNRDPKVIWHEPSHQWVMVLYVEKDKKHLIQFFTSPDLKTWTYRSEVTGFFECPDLFELPIDGDRSKTLWVLTAANSEYMLGTFDGATFSPVSGKLPGHRGKGFYAAQTFSDAPQGRRLQIGWLQAPSPGMPFNQCMSLPLELGLRTTPDGPRLTMVPAAETNALTDAGRPVAGEKVPELVRLEAEFSPGTAREVSITLRGATIVYDCVKQEFVVNGHRAPAPLIDGRQVVTIFLDRTTLELFASSGLVYIPLPFIAQPDDLDLRVAGSGGEESSRSRSGRSHRRGHSEPRVPTTGGRCFQPSSIHRSSHPRRRIRSVRATVQIRWAGWKDRPPLPDESGLVQKWASGAGAGPVRGHLEEEARLSAPSRPRIAVRERKGTSHLLPPSPRARALTSCPGETLSRQAGPCTAIRNSQDARVLDVWF